MNGLECSLYIQHNVYSTLIRYAIQFLVPTTTTTTTTTTTANPPSGGGGGCFPSVAIVQNKNEESVNMSGLKTGDKVQTGKNIKCQMY